MQLLIITQKKIAGLVKNPGHSLAITALTKLASKELVYFLTLTTCVTFFVMFLRMFKNLQLGKMSRAVCFTLFKRTVNQIRVIEF